MLEWWSKIRNLLARERGFQNELGDEIQSHIDFMTEENVDRGMSPDEARAAARRNFGNRTTVS